jgi:adenylosuccinate synthase
LVKTKFTGVYYRDTKNKERIYYIKFTENSKQVKEKIGSNTEGITAAYASKIRAKRTSVDRLKDDAPMLQNQKLPTFDEAFKMYMERIKNKGDARNTQGRYDLHIKKTFGHLRLDEITTEMIENFKNKERTQ